MITLAMMFKDGMVLQREKKAAVFGTTDSREPVTVLMQGKSAAAVPDADGHWCVQAGPFEASTGEEMTIAQGGDTITLRDVAVGEVYLAGGQSNMEFVMRYDRGLAEELQELQAAPNPDIRFFDYPEVSYVGQLRDADYTQHYGFWRKADPEDLQWWSAVSYYFAKKLYAKYRVPVGIVGCNWGGTNISCWLPEEVLKACGAEFYLDEYKEQTKDLDPEAYEKSFRANPRNFRTNQLEGEGHEIEDFIMRGDYGADLLQRMGAMIMENAKKAGIRIDMSSVASMMPVMGPKHEWRPCGVYYSMLLPVVPYTFRGVLWYQGESDGDEEGRAQLYEKVFPALIAHWRKLFRDPELPFLFVQIAPYEKWMNNQGTNYGIVRWAQKKTAETVPGTGMAVITDDGMRWDIHPVIKSVVGARLALLAENRIYKDTSVLCEAPLLAGVKAEEGRAVLSFDHAGEGLHLADTTLYGEKIPADTLTGAKLVQGDTVIPSETCRASVSGNTVILESDSIHAGIPTHAAVADDVWYQVNLYNSADIPAQVARV